MEGTDGRYYCTGYDSQTVNTGGQEWINSGRHNFHQLITTLDDCCREWCNRLLELLIQPLMHENVIRDDAGHRPLVMCIMEKNNFS